MPNDIAPMHDYFAKLGLEPEIADVYLALHAYGPQNLLQLARSAKIERTRLYRLIDTLIDCQLIEVETHYKRKMYVAAPIDNLQILITHREQEVRDLQEGLKQLKDSFAVSSLRSPLSHVQFYRGQEGIKQMFWNETKARTENLSILYENIQNKTNLAFFERWVERCNERQMHFRSLIGQHFLATQRDWYAEHANEKLQHWQGRQLPEDVFPITHSMVTYDDVVAYYNWQNGEIFGIELYNPEIAAAQARLFELLWQQGQPIAGHGEHYPVTSE